MVQKRAVRFIDNIEMAQKRAVRFICNLKGVCSVTEHREKLRLETLETRRKTLVCNIIASETPYASLLSSFPEITSSKEPSCFVTNKSSYYCH